MRMVDALHVNVYDVVNSRYIILIRVGAAEADGGAGLMKNANEIIRRPLVTEKSTMHEGDGERDRVRSRPNANKIQVKRAVEELFKVKVDEVRLFNVRGKMKRLGRFAGKPPRLAEGVRAAGGRREGARVLRGRVRNQARSRRGHYACQNIQADVGRESGSSSHSDFDGDHARAPGEVADARKDEDRRPQQQGPHHVALHRRRPQAEAIARSTSAATSTACPGRSRRSSTTRTAARASR